jgi:hypothetical protein
MSAPSRLSRARHQQAPACGRASAMRVDAGTSIALWAQAREDFHEQTALEAVITFLRQYGRPRQMTFDRDPRSRWGCVRPGFSLAAASAFVVLGHRSTHLPATSPSQKCGTLERYHRTYGQECLHIHRPSTLKAGT